MKTYQLKPEGFKAVRKQVIQRLAIMAVLLIAFLFYLETNSNMGVSKQADVLKIVLPLALLAIGTGIFRGIKLQRERFDSFRIILEGDRISRIQKDIPDLVLEQSEIERILVTSAGALVIKSAVANRSIGIPESIDNKEDLIHSLGQIKVIEPYQEKTGNDWWKYLLIVFLMFSLAAIFYTATNPSLILGTGIILVVVLGWSLIQISKSPHLEAKIKKWSRWGWFVLFTFIARMILVVIEKWG